jgi:hypothetical protein
VLVSILTILLYITSNRLFLIGRVDCAEKYVHMTTICYDQLTDGVLQKCDEQREGESCRTCIRLTIDCLGWGPKRPEWMRVSSF